MSKNYQGPFVSRGGEKLRGALSDFALDVNGKRALDIGASTGGFTDCLLQAGAAQVVSLDVAYGQFAWKLRNDERVRVVERTNIKYADLAELGAPFDVVVADLSFISLATIAEQLKVAAGDRGDLVLLVKPQFEAAREEVGQGGVIRDAATHSAVLGRLGKAFREVGIAPQGWTHSPLRGPKGNIEFWLWAKVLTDVSEALAGGGECATIEEVVRVAHERAGRTGDDGEVSADI